MAVPRTVDWSTIEENEFNRLVEALLVEDWTKRGFRAEAIDGKGGDEGIDVGVWKGDELVHVFQLKWFREGFSGYHGKTRKSQISGSFKRAVRAAPALPAWTLVAPCIGSIPERSFVRALGHGTPTATDFFGSTGLDGLLSKYPSLNRWATREPLLDALSELGREEAALGDVNDLLRRAERLRDSMDTMSAYWGVKLTVEPGMTTIEHVAKRPDAAEKEPLSLNVMMAFSPDQEGLRKQWETAIDFGLLAPLTLPPEVVRSYHWEGPDWAQHDGGAGALELRPIAELRDLPVEIRSLDANGRSLAALAGKVTRTVRGAKGGLLEMTFGGFMTMTWKLPREGNGGEVGMNYEVIGKSASEVLPGVRWAASLSGAERVEVSIDGSTAFAVQIPQAEATEVVDDGMIALLEDLAYLEGEFRAVLRFPSEISNRDVLAIRFVRMLREGRVALIPGLHSINTGLSGEALESIREFVEGSPKAIRVELPEYAAEILEQSFEVGRVVYWSPSALVVNAAEVVAAIDEGRAAGHPLIVKPTDDSGFRAFMPERLAPGAKLIPEPWGVPGIPEHPMLESIRGRGAISAKDASKPRDES